MRAGPTSGTSTTAVTIDTNGTSTTTNNVALGTGHVKAFIFVIAMVAGMGIFEVAERKWGTRSKTTAAATHPHPPVHPRPRARKG